MSYCRIDPTKIKIIEAQTGKRGGQGVVVVGTLSPSEAMDDKSPELKVAVKKLEWQRDDAEESAKFFKVSSGLGCNGCLTVLTARYLLFVSLSSTNSI